MDYDLVERLKVLALELTYKGKFTTQSFLVKEAAKAIEVYEEEKTRRVWPLQSSTGGKPPAPSNKTKTLPPDW